MLAFDFSVLKMSVKPDIGDQVGIVFFLKAYTVLQGSNIMTQVQWAGGTVASEYSFRIASSSSLLVISQIVSS